MKINTHSAATAKNQRHRTTKEFAIARLVKPQTVRKQYSSTGSYFGVRPIKLPNRFLAWPPEGTPQILAEDM